MRNRTERAFSSNARTYSSISFAAFSAAAALSRALGTSSSSSSSAPAPSVERRARGVFATAAASTSHGNGVGAFIAALSRAASLLAAIFSRSSSVAFAGGGRAGPSRFRRSSSASAASSSARRAAMASLSRICESICASTCSFSSSRNAHGSTPSSECHSMFTYSATSFATARPSALLLYDACCSAEMSPPSRRVFSACILPYAPRLSSFAMRSSVCSTSMA